MAFGTGAVIRGILGLQVGIALALLAGDFFAILPDLLTDRRTNAPALDAPVRPGDQTRRFDPRTLPADRVSPSRPGIQMPAGSPDMPTELTFTAAETPGRYLISGEIQPGDAARYADWRASLPTPPEVLVLHSPGGSVGDALAIGRQIRTEAIDTAMEATGVSLSACPYMLMAGTERVIARGAWVGVHQHYYGESTVLPAFLAVKDIQLSQAEVVAYLDGMGIDLRLMKHSLATPPEDIYILLDEELTEYNVATELTGGES
ncbi:MAG: hypothetical protein CL812_14165 [Confluentimicrobium sp.]|nr:hypothetical protein [Actibacterium sp.]